VFVHKTGGIEGGAVGDGSAGGNGGGASGDGGDGGGASGGVAGGIFRGTTGSGHVPPQQYVLDGAPTARTSSPPPPAPPPARRKASAWPNCALGGTLLSSALLIRDWPLTVAFAKR